MLRTFFVWEDLKSPIQVVRERVEVRLQVHDWRALTGDQQQKKLDDFVREDRAQGFDLGEAPLFRLALFRLSDDQNLFLWTRHHLILDGWSINILLAEVFSLYKSKVEKKPARLAAPRAYRNYIAWLQRQDLAKAEAYWRRALGGFSSPTAIAVEQKPDQSATDSHLLADEKILLSDSTTSLLQATARRNRLTLNTLTQAAWAIVLSVYSGTSDVVFGSVVSGRPVEVEGIETMVGLFINTLPVRVRLDGEEKVIAWLRRLQQEHAEARFYEYSPLYEVHGWSDVPRHLSLFDSVLIFENYYESNAGEQMPGPQAGLKMGEVTSRQQGNYGLTVLATPDRRMQLRICYDASRFNRPTITRMLGHLKTALESLAANPNKRLSDVSILTESEKHEMLVEWNHTRRDCPAEFCAHQLVERQAGRQPDALALSLEDEQITYGELNRRANRLAHRLRRLGAGPEVMVGVCMERSIEWVIAVLGVFKSGGTLVSIDPTYPKDRLAFMAKDAQVEILLTAERLLSQLGDTEAKTLCVDSQWPSISAESARDPRPLATAENSSYVVYTSGSTGRPKAAVMSHGSLLNLIHWHNRACEVTSSDRATQVSRMGFDASMWELWPYLAAGASLHLLDEETRMIPQRLRDWILRKQITKSFLPPVLAESLLNEQWPERTALGLLLTGSDKCVIRPPASLPFNYMNVYGPTEATVIVTWHMVPPDDGSGTPPLIGRPLDNTQIYILDGRRHPAPVKVPGELYIGGVNLARGYLNRADLTAEKFVPNPFSGEPGSRLYRTGDLARFHPDGEVEFLGRIDYQVKIRGFRIELGEIETTLAQHPSVDTAVVIMREDSPGDKRLVAYVVARPQVEIRSGDLRGFLSERLPDYMVPSAFIALDRFPLTPNSKVDRRALPAPDRGARDEETYVAPRDQVEERLARIWEDVLGVRSVGVDDDFFALGGHSMLAVRLMAQVHKEFNRSLPLSTLFQKATVAKLASMLREEASPAAWSPVVAIQAEGTRTPFFCVAPIGGQVFGYYDLARHLGREQPFYGLQAPGPADVGGVHAAIGDMSNEYIEAIRAIQPQGPYLIGGQSFGGLVAFDIASKLVSRGQEVALLALLDAWSPVIFERLPEQNDDAMLLAVLARTLAREKSKTLLLSPDELRRMGPDERLAYFLEQARGAEILGQDVPEDIGIPFIRRFLEGYRARLIAVRRYAPAVYPGVITLFRASEEDPESVKELQDVGWDIYEPTYGWAALSLSTVEVQIVPGTHETIGQEPNVKELARLLSDRMLRATASPTRYAAG
nr:condensation domain-containing protein [uncultured bacterium]